MGTKDLQIPLKERGKERLHTHTHTRTHARTHARTHTHTHTESDMEMEQSDWSDSARSQGMPAATDAGRSKKWIFLDFGATTLISGFWLQNCCLKPLSLWQFFTAASGNYGNPDVMLSLWSCCHLLFTGVLQMSWSEAWKFQLLQAQPWDKHNQSTEPTPWHSNPYSSKSRNQGTRKIKKPY